MANQYTAACSEDEFIHLLAAHGATSTAKKLDITVRSVYRRKKRIEERDGLKLLTADGRLPIAKEEPLDHVRRQLTIKDGIVMIGSDAHYWPGEVSTAHLSFLDVAKKVKPTHVITNGDMFDGARISRHPPLGWENLPTVADELAACQDRMGEIYDATKKAWHCWTLGNHDSRLERRLATEVPEMEGVHGTHLKDHFPKWLPALSVWINSDQDECGPNRTVVCKHNWHNGVHAAYQNALKSGVTLVTGHTHKQQVRSWTDYTGRRYGIECGTMAPIYGTQFLYAADNPRDWVSGFVVLTFRDYRLMYPEVVAVLDEGRYEFRREEFTV